jgi:hypothetical protein
LQLKARWYSFQVAAGQVKVSPATALPSLRSLKGYTAVARFRKPKRKERSQHSPGKRVCRFKWIHLR